MSGSKVSSLYRSIFEHEPFDPEHASWSSVGYTQINFDNFTPLRRLLAVIYYLPMDWRKPILDACRIQRPITENKHLSSSYYAIKNSAYRVAIPRKRGSDIYETFYISDVDEAFKNFYDNPLLCSCPSYFVRAEGSIFLDQFLQVKDDTSLKEISASQLPDRPQQLDYTCLGTIACTIISSLRPTLVEGMMKLEKKYVVYSANPLFLVRLLINYSLPQCLCPWMTSPC